MEKSYRMDSAGKYALNGFVSIFHLQKLHWQIKLQSVDLHFKQLTNKSHVDKDNLRLPHRNDAKIDCSSANKSSFQNPEKSLFAQQKSFLSEKIVHWLNYSPKCTAVADFCCFGIIPMR